MFAATHKVVGLTGRSHTPATLTGTTDLFESNHPWYRKKGYIHFDLPLDQIGAEKYVSDPKNVERHSFYPFIRFSLTERRARQTSKSPQIFESDPKSRPISYPAHRDGYIFSYYRHLLSVLYEEELTRRGLRDSVTAFRQTGQDNIDLAKKAFDHVRGDGEWDIYATDVTSYYNNIDHVRLKAKWCDLLGLARLPQDHYAVYKALTGYGYVKFHKLFNLFRLPMPPIRTDRNRLRICTPEQFRTRLVPKNLIIRGSEGSKGVPQGSSISPFLSNLYLLDVDTELSSLANKLGGQYWRYCDDVLIIVPRGNMKNVESATISALKAEKLEASCKKTFRISTYANSEYDFIGEHPLQYLGLVFDGCEVKIRESSLTRYRRKMKKGIKAAQVQQSIETAARSDCKRAPLRRTSLYNMYSRLETRGKKVLESKSKTPYGGNFVTYMAKALQKTESKLIRRQMHMIWTQLRSEISNSE